MSDFEKLINASDLIEWIMETDPDWCVGVVRSIVDHVEAMPAAKPKWIPCSEGLPDITDHHTSEPCLVHCDNGAYTFAELEENIFGQVGWSCERDDDYHEAIGTVIAWMPLPEPYKEGKDGTTA